MPPKLRAVAADEKPPEKPTKPKTVTEAAKSGSTRDLLVAMRDRIAVAVEDPNTPARDLAALTKRLTETVKDIEAIDARDSEEGVGSRRVEDAIFNPAAV